MEFHELANLFPMMSEAELNLLVEDMCVNGYDTSSPIVMYEDKILDGRNRYKAAQAAKVEPVFITLNHGSDPLEFVLRHNLHRRHLNESQRAMIAAKLANMKRTDTLKQNRSANLHIGGSPIEDINAWEAKPLSQAQAAKMMNVSPRLVASAKRIYEIAPVTIIENINNGKLAVSQYGRRFTREAKIEKISQGNKPLDKKGKKYSVILADPPWQYEHPISDSRKIENQYPTMSIDKICEIPINAICSENAVIFLWATTPMLKKGIQVLDAWGFEYRTSMVWVKPSIGPGHWVRNRHEYLFIGVRGDIPTPENKPDSVIEAPRTGHSVKPECVYEIIERMYPELERVELFARNQRKGWDAWGNQS